MNTGVSRTTWVATVTGDQADHSYEPGHTVKVGALYQKNLAELLGNWPDAPDAGCVPRKLTSRHPLFKLRDEMARSA